MAGVGRQLLETLHKRQLKLFGHVMRSNGLEKLVVTGKTDDKSKRDTNDEIHCEPKKTSKCFVISSTKPNRF